MPACAEWVVSSYQPSPSAFICCAGERLHRSSRSATDCAPGAQSLKSDAAFRELGAKWHFMSSTYSHKFVCSAAFRVFAQFVGQRLCCGIGRRGCRDDGWPPGRRCRLRRTRCRSIRCDGGAAGCCVSVSGRAGRAVGFAGARFASAGRLRRRCAGLAPSIMKRRVRRRGDQQRHRAAFERVSAARCIRFLAERIFGVRRVEHHAPSAVRHETPAAESRCARDAH